MEFDTTLQKGMDLITRAAEEDRDKNYEEAVRLYEEGIDHFLHAMKYEVQGEQIKESVRAKSVQYLERAEEIMEQLKKEKKEPISDGAPKDEKRSTSDKNPEKKKPQKKMNRAIVGLLRICELLF